MLNINKNNRHLIEDQNQTQKVAVHRRKNQFYHHSPQVNKQVEAKITNLNQNMNQGDLVEDLQINKHNQHQNQNHHLSQQRQE